MPRKTERWCGCSCVKIKAGKASAETRLNRTEIRFYKFIRPAIRGKTAFADINIDRIVAVEKRDFVRGALVIGRLNFYLARRAGYNCQKIFFAVPLNFCGGIKLVFDLYAPG